MVDLGLLKSGKEEVQRRNLREFLGIHCKKLTLIRVDFDLAIKEVLTFFQTRSNAIILQGTLPAYCMPKVERLKTGDVLYEKAFLSPRPPPKSH